MKPNLTGELIKSYCIEELPRTCELRVIEPASNQYVSVQECESKESVQYREHASSELVSQLSSELINQPIADVEDEPERQRNNRKRVNDANKVAG